MAFGDLTALTSPVTDKDVTAMATAGTTVYVATNDGFIWQYTISGQAAYIMNGIKFNEKITAMTILTTNLYVADAKGRIHKIAITGSTTTLSGTLTDSSQTCGGTISALTTYAGSTLLYVWVKGQDMVPTNSSFYSVALS